MRWWRLGLVAAVMGLAACTDTDEILGPGTQPDAPRALDVTYYNRSVTVSWELGPAWDGEHQRIALDVGRDGLWGPSSVLSWLVRDTGGGARQTDDRGDLLHREIGPSRSNCAV